MQSKPLSRYWLMIGGAALAVAGLFSLVLVVARTPQLASLPFFTKLFHEALVVHVDLSVLVWFLAIACLLWSRQTQAVRSRLPYIEEAALISFALGALAIAASPLDPRAEALMSNYIPVIHSPVFFLGLGLIFCAVGLMAAKIVFSPGAENDFAPFSAALIALVALAAFVWSALHMPPEIDGTQYYELAFWGGGHVLQFVHTQIMMACWLMLLAGLGAGAPLPRSWLYAVFSIGLIAAFATPLAYRHDVASMEHRDFFTHTMIWAGGLAPSLLALWVVATVWRAKKSYQPGRRALWSALIASLVLFIYGGLLGAMISGQNVVIPAHYHGSIVGITLAFMGVAYLLLPELGYRDPAGWRLAFWQPIVYAIGQVMHISGLAYSGGYGVLRKTPGEVANISLSVKAALGFMGLGGLLAIIGGLMFVVVLARAVWGKR